MARTLLVLVVTILLVSMLPTAMGTTNIIDDTTELNQVNNYTEIDGYDFSQTPDMAEMNLTIVFLGFNESIISQTYLEEELINWYAPIDRLPEAYTKGAGEQLDFDVNYTINYEFDFRPDNEVVDYINFVDTNSNIGEVGFEWPYYMEESYDSANYIRSEVAENYLANLYHDDVNPTLVLIDTYSEYQSTFNPYYYNSSYGDLDNPDALGRRYSSTNQVAGGGSDSRLLFADYSAGPHTYYDFNREIHPGVYDYDLFNTTEVNLLNDLIEKDIESSIEFRFLPSYIYSPITPSPGQDVVFEILPINFELLSNVEGFSSVPTSQVDPLSAFDEETFIADFEIINPNINWKYRILNAWDWTTNPDFIEYMQNATTVYDANSGYIESDPLFEYFDENYGSLFSSGNSSEFVMPVFLWFLPGSYSTDFGGVAWSDNFGDFTYMINVASHDSVVGKQRSIDYTVNEPFDIAPSNYSTSLYFVGQLEGDELETSLTINSGEAVTLEIMTMEEYVKFSNSQSYTSIYESPVLDEFSSGVNDNITSGESYSVYAWVIKNSGISSASVSLTIIRYYTVNTGFTRVAIHEAGHSIGISHPHDGFSWELRDGVSEWGSYVDWLWDQSYTTMTYAASIPGLSPMDHDTYRRGVLTDYFNLAYENFIETKSEVSELHDYFPQGVYEYIEEAKSEYDNAIHSFISWNYAEAMDQIFSSLENIELAKEAIPSSVFHHTLLFNGLDNLPEDDFVTVEIYIAEFDKETFEITDNTAIDYDNMGYYNIEIQVYHSNGTLLVSFVGYTWDAINLIVPEGTYPDSATSDPNNTASSDNDGSELAFLPISLWTFVFPIGILSYIGRSRKN